MRAILDESPEPYMIRGEWRYRALPADHGRVQHAISGVAQALDHWRSEHPEADCQVLRHPGFYFSRDRATLMRVPLAVVKGRLPPLQSGWLGGTPLLVAEVMLGKERYGDMWDRVAEYLECGVPLVWLFTPGDHTVTIHRPNNDVEALDSRDTLTGDPELPGFSCPVAEFFR